MKIICFLFDPNVGGPTIRARNVYERMMKEGYSIRVAFPRNEGPALDFLAQKGIPTDRLNIAKPVLPRKLGPFVRFVFTAPVALLRMVAYLLRERPDLIHVNGAFDLIPACAGWLTRTPVVWHLNDTAFGAGLSKILGRVVKLLSSTIIIAARRVGEHYNVMERKPHIVHAPVDIARLPVSDRISHPAIPPQLILIGNWNWIKGQERFVAVLKKLRDRGTQASGLVIGRFIEGQKDYWEPILDQVQAYGLSDIFEAPGYLEEPYERLAQSDILLLTSHSEASPMALLEAMAIGVPVVTFDVGGVREMLGEGNEAAGFVVSRDDVQSMVEAVEVLLNDRETYLRMSGNGQKRARAHFSLEECVSRHKEVYAETLSGKGK
ncbi:glycosyltransferase family 4 protein [Paracoccaceae bacterium]|nr:glycosyltransferase family 4 protein [Paracoccaceae bacterium]